MVSLHACTYDADTAWPSSGNLLDLLNEIIAKGSRFKARAQPRDSNVCERVRPQWERNCFWVTHQACISVFGGPRGNNPVYRPVSKKVQKEVGVNIDKALGFGRQSCIHQTRHSLQRRQVKKMGVGLAAVKLVSIKLGSCLTRHMFRSSQSRWVWSNMYV